MTWVIAVGASLKCGSCETPIGRGEVYAVVTEAQLKRCADCGLAIVRATILAAWDAKGLCPYARLAGRLVACLWPAQLEADVAKRVGIHTTTQTDAVPVMDFGERLRAAIQRSRHAAA